MNVKDLVTLRGRIHRGWSAERALTTRAARFSEQEAALRTLMKDEDAKC